MIGIKKRMVYEAFGLNIASEMSFPELPLSYRRDGIVDVEIEFGDLTALYEELAIANNKRMVVEESRFMFRIADSAIFLVENGKKITVSPVPECDEGMLRLFILGSCMGALLLQRRIFPLHGSAVAIDGKAYAIIGESGAGKSTLASALIKKGMLFISDDVVALSFEKDQRPIVTPSYPQQKLWQESLEGFGMQAEDYVPIYNRETKYSVPVHSGYVRSTMPLAGIFELIKNDEQHIELQKIGKLEQLSTVFLHTYRNFLIRRMELVEWHFLHSLNIANHAAFYRLQRPAARFSANELADLIIDKVKKPND